MSALKLYRLGLDTMQIAERLEITEAQAEWAVHHQREQERIQKLRKEERAAKVFSNDRTLKQLQAEGILP